MKYTTKKHYSEEFKKEAIVNAVSAQTASEALILTSNNQKLIYRGPFNDRHHLLKSGLKIKNNYVSDILDAIVSGKKFIPREIQLQNALLFALQ